MSSDIDRLSAHAAELRRQRQPHVTVKVVWVAPPSSGKPGNTAVVTPDGHVDGWVGGSCAEPVVVKEALAAMGSGLPRLVHLGPSGESGPARDGVVNVAMSCASEGSLEIFIEPYLPAPRLVVVGRAPVVRALVGMARAIDFDVCVVERDPTGEPWPDDVEVRTELDLTGVGAESYVVVATFGRYDEEALGAALATEAAYIGLVASAKRSATALSLMGSIGTPQGELARIHSPAGLDLGSLPHTHMAVPILAEIVAKRSQAILSQADHGATGSGATGSGATRPTPAPGPTAAAPVAGPVEVVDPVCGMTVDLSATRETAEHNGLTYGFCCGGCRLRFLADPGSYLESAETSTASN